ncbi:RHS repeat-associated core domain-containing protein, partial [Pseudomonas cichorii]
ITAQAGRNGVRVLHWQAGKPAELTNDQYRYSLTDHLGSSTLELDKDAQIISQESYYPFGGTSWWADRDSIEANYKTVRYSGKERDATGLYYYGLRYYAPWLQRWINP